MSRYVSMNSMNSMNSMKLPTGTQESSGVLSKIMSAGGNISTSTIVIISVIILFVGIAIYYYYYHISPSSKPVYNANHEQMPSSSSNGKEAELLLFYVDWCPHCKTAKPIWNDLKSEYQNKTINGYQVIFTEINCSEETAEVEKLMNQYNVEGYPTIKLLKDGQIIEYDAKPSKETLTQFLNTVL